MSCIYKYKGKDYTKEEFYSLVSNSNFIQQEQIKKFDELQERLNNKEFLEGAKNAFESSEELQNVYYEAAGFDVELPSYDNIIETDNKKDKKERLEQRKELVLREINAIEQLIKTNPDEITIYHSKPYEDAYEVIKYFDKNNWEKDDSKYKESEIITKPSYLHNHLEEELQKRIKNLQIINSSLYSDVEKVNYSNIFKEGKSYSSVEVLKYISNNKKDVLSEIAKTLIKYAEKNNVEIQIVKEAPKKLAGVYSYSNKIEIYGNKNVTSHTLIHEIIHSFSSVYIRNNPKSLPVLQLENILKNILDKKILKEYSNFEGSYEDYATKNIHELLAEIISRPDILSHLALYDTNYNLIKDAYKKETLLDKIIKTLSDIFNFSKNEIETLSDLILFNARDIFEASPLWSEFNRNQLTPQQKQDALNAYTDYIARVSLGIVKNPSSGEYNYESKVKDIVYHHSSQKLENFDKSFLGKETSAPDTQLGFFFAEDKNDIPKMVVEKNKQLGELGENKRLNFSVQNNVLLNIKNPEFYYGFIEEAVSNILGRETRITSATARQDYKEAKEKLENNNKDALIYGLAIEPDGEGGTDVNKGYVVFEPEQIHILGSKQDIEGFKKYVGKDTSDTSKEGVSELFESNPELANAVYRALGFDKQINEIADTKKVDEFIKKYKDALPNIKDGKTLISHLQTVSNRNTGTTKQFADLIIKLSKSNKGLEKLLNNPNLYAKPNSVGDEGVFHWSLFSNLSVNKIVLELDHFKNNTYDDVFLHELIHNLTTQFIVKDSDLFNQSFYNKVKELYSVFDNHLEANKKVNESLLEYTKNDIKDLKKLKEYFEILPSDAIQHELLFGKIGSISTVKDVKLDYKSLENKSKQDVIKELERLSSFKESRIQEIEKGDKDYYYFNSKTFKQENVLSEFLATFMNDANFREQLKNIDYKNNKSIFQSIIDLISEFIGLTKNDSLYNEFVLNLTNFINNNDYSTIAEQTQKTAYQNRINLLEQQKQQAQQKFQEYINATGKQDIEGFKEFIGGERQYQKEVTQADIDSAFRASVSEKKQLTKKQLQNKKLDLYNQILSDPKSYIMMMTSLDTVDIKTKINKLFPETEVADDLDFYTPARQREIRQEFYGGKVGVGIAANHMVDHALAQYHKFFLKYDLGVGHRNIFSTSISGTNALPQDDGTIIPITQTLSEFLTAFVDIAKDPYILRGNFNSKTSDVAFMLIRAGVPTDWMVAFIGQPILKDLAKMQMIHEGRIKPPVEKGEYMTAAQKVEKQYMAEGALFDPSSLSVAKLEEMIRDKQKMSQEEFNEVHSEHQALVYRAFAEFKKVAMLLEDSMRASKQDTKGIGQSYFSSMVSDYYYDRVMSSGIIGNYHTKFEGTMLGQYKDGTTQAKDAFYNGRTLNASEGFQKILKHYKIMYDPFIEKDEEAMLLLSKHYYTALLSIPSSPISGNLEELTVGEEGVLEMALFLKEDMPENTFISALTVSTEEFGAIYIENVNNLPFFEKNAIMDDFAKLIFHKDMFLRQFAENLVKYSFLTSGFQPAMKSFHSVIPPVYMDLIGFNKFIKDAIDSPIPLISVDSFITDFVKNNYKNTNFVKKIYDDVKVGANGVIKVKVDGRIIVGANIEGEKEAVRHVLYNNNLYKLAGYNFMDEKGGNVKYAVYSKINKMGHTHRGFKIIEYGKQMSIDAENNKVKSIFVPETAKDIQPMMANQSLMIDLAINEKPGEEVIKEFYNSLSLTQQGVLGNYNAVLYGFYASDAPVAEHIESLKQELNCAI